MTQNKIWVIDDDRAMRWVLEKTFKEEGFEVTSFEEAQSALDQLTEDIPDVILTDIRMPGIDGLTFLAKVKASHPDLPVIIMTAHSDLESAVSSYQTGAFEYLPKPFDIDEALAWSTVPLCTSTNYNNKNLPRQFNRFNRLKSLVNRLPCRKYFVPLVVWLNPISPY